MEVWGRLVCGTFVCLIKIHGGVGRLVCGTFVCLIKIHGGVG